jgi:hypothetical protein
MIIAVDNLVAATVSQQMGLSKTIIITGPDLRQADRLLDPILCRYGGGTAMIRGLLHLVVKVAETLALTGPANGALDRAYDRLVGRRYQADGLTDRLNPGRAPGAMHIRLDQVHRADFDHEQAQAIVEGVPHWGWLAVEQVSGGLSVCEKVASLGGRVVILRSLYHICSALSVDSCADSPTF